MFKVSVVFGNENEDDDYNIESYEKQVSRTVEYDL